MLKKQTQSVGDNSTVIQAEGDVSTGLTYHEVKEIASDLIELNLLKIQELAEQTAMRRVESFCQTLFSALSINHDADDVRDGLIEPNTQFILVEVLKQVARKKKTDTYQFLAETISQCISVKDNDSLSQLCSDAAMAASKLTHNQLKILSLVFLTSKIGVSSPPNSISFSAFIENMSSIIENTVSAVDDVVLDRYSIRYVTHEPYMREGWAPGGTFFVPSFQNNMPIFEKFRNKLIDTKSWTSNPLFHLETEKLLNIFNLSEGAKNIIRLWDKFHLSYYSLTETGKIVAIQYLAMNRDNYPNLHFPDFEKFYPSRVQNG